MERDCDGDSSPKRRMASRQRRLAERLAFLRRGIRDDGDAPSRGEAGRSCMVLAKGSGGEAAHGMLLLSPSALARLESYQPPWPVPKLFQLSKAGKVNAGIFRGATINTPSMLGVEDALSALRWAEREGGLRALIARSNENLEIVSRWEARVPWCSFVAAKPEWRSPTSICLRVRHSADVLESWSFVRRMVGLLHAEEVAYDIAGHRDGVPGLRIWGGPTVDPEDMEALLPWLEWAYHEASD